MFNSGGIWQGHLARTRDLVLSRLPVSPTVIDIGCGEGHFVRGLADARNGQGRFVGFDPNAKPDTGKGLEFFPSYFEPLSHVSAFKPDAVVIRHVLEHLTSPAILLEQLAWSTHIQDKETWLFAEVPCIDRVFESRRLADFFYEHVSHFTTESFQALMLRAGDIVDLSHGYDGEVVYALVRLGISNQSINRATQSIRFAEEATASRRKIRAQLASLASSGKRVAIWGGTGKAAAFIHQFSADVERFPLVVDSDPEKAGTFVPETGQQIVFRDTLKQQSIDVVIIPTQWRARDIVAEMKREDIQIPTVLIEHGGRLINFDSDDHPYQ